MSFASGISLRTLVAVLLTTWALPSCADDLMDVYTLARRADPVLAAADAARRVVHEGVVQARAPLLPQLAANVSLGQTSVAGLPANDPSITDRNRGRDVSANLTQVIVDIAKLSQLKAAEAQADAQDATYEAAQQTLAVRVATAYFNVLTAADSVANVQANEDAYRQQVEQADQRYRNGLSAAVDVEQARAYHAAARATTIAARAALGDAREALAEITGVQAGELKTLREDLPMTLPAPADPQAWVQTALAANPQVRAQQLGLSAAEQSIRAARAGHWPTLSASLGVGRANNWPIQQSASDGYTATNVGLVLNVPLFAGGATQSLVRQAQYQRDGAADALESQRRAVARTALDQYRRVVADIGQIEATRASVDAARKALASTRVGQQVGTQTMTDLLLAIQTLTSAQGSYSSVRHQYILDELLLQQAAGSIGESDLAAVNTLLQ